MPHCSRKLIALHTVLLLLAFSSCMPQKKPAIDRTPGKLMQPTQPTRTTSEQYINQGDFIKALDLSAAACRNNPTDQSLLANYHQIIEEVLLAADEALRREDFASSGRAYFALLNDYPRYQKLDRKVSIDRGFLHARLKDCRSNLSQRALAEYRKGNLTEAISLWKSILAFDPQNAAIKKTIDRAAIQMKNLKEEKD
jgi:tetratricopeptide (TPR) repeat protein